MPVSALAELLPGAARAQAGFGWHMHNGGYMAGGGWGGWGAWAVIHVVFWALFFIAAIILTFFVVRSLGRGEQKKDEDSRSSALDQLDERYARGEIDREDYLQRKRDITDR